MIKSIKAICSFLKFLIAGILALIACLISLKSQSETCQKEVKSIVHLPLKDFQFNVDPETFAIKVTHNGIEESVSTPFPKMAINGVQRSASSVSWFLPNRNISIKVEKKKDFLDVTIHSEGAENFTWPKVKAKSYMLPLWEGKYIPANDSLWQAFLNGKSFNFMQSFSMGFFALNKSRYTILYVAKNTFNNTIRFDTGPEVSFSFFHEFPRINKEKNYGFRIYLTENNPAAISKVYKDYIQEIGRFKTLEEKAKENPNIRKLYGAPQIYFWPHGLIAEKNIHWKILQTSWKSQESLFSWMKYLLMTYDEVDAANQFNTVWQEAKSQTYINEYQKKVIVGALNKVLAMKELYNPKVFNNTKPISNINELGEQKLYNLNKTLLKSALKETVDAPQEWGKSNTALLDEMYQSGIKKAWICFSDWADGLKNPGFVAKANQLGYLIGPYDSYHDIHNEEDKSWRAPWFMDTTLFENATITNAFGKKYEGFLGRGRLLSPTLALPSVKQRVQAILQGGVAYNMWFLDCDATGEIFDDYTPGHLTTQEEDFNARLSRMDYIANKHNMVIGSEGGNDYASRSLAYAQGLEMPVFDWSDPDFRKNRNSPYYLGDYWAPPGNIPSKYIKVVPVKNLYHHIYLEPSYSLPLFRLVYNDAVITTPHWESGSLRFKNEVSTRMLAELLYNSPPLYHLDQDQWIVNKERIVKHLKVWSQTHEKAVLEPMTAFNILTDDRQVQQTTFGNSLKITVNFSDEDFTFEGKIIRPKSALIQNGSSQIIYTVGEI
ncbi:glycoside hydrolase [Sabulibacter ruber]|uniref:glycoside hydrolase n=1 Tax=Sabulibacter ruber TaxID=2811901 RepID=UPI001A95EF44|nr:glycoside hydrolase [Sabulibacter ruber]